jgi:hypothetical protein
MERDCNKYDNQILSFFRALVPAYLHKYGFYLITEKAECINVKGHFVEGDDPTQYGLDTLAAAVKRGEEWGRHLTVIVFDNKAGYLYSNAFNAGGHYYWKNYEHIVTTSTFGYKGESDWNALVLSEEVSHFVLRYLGYPEEIWGDGTDTSYVHANRNKFLECKANHDLYSTGCSKTWTTIEGRTLRTDGTGYYVATFRVLAPYDKPIPKPTVPQVDPFESKATEIRLKVWNGYFEILRNIQNKQQEIDSLKFESPNAKNNLQTAINTLSSATSYSDLVKHNLDVAENLFNRDLYEPAFNTFDGENDALTSIKTLLFDISRSINSAKEIENEYQEQKQLREKTSQIPSNPSNSPTIKPENTQSGNYVEKSARQILAELDRSAIHEPKLYSLSKITPRINKIENALVQLDEKLQHVSSLMMEQEKYSNNEDAIKHFRKAQGIYDQLKKNLVAANGLGSQIVRVYNSAIEKNDAEFADSIAYRQLLLNLESLEQKIENIDSLANFIKQELDSAKGIVEGYYRLQIPTWIKNNVHWWSEGNIDDEDFLASLEFMIKNKIINIPNLPKQSQTSQEIPDWVRNNAKWWSEGKISDSDFVSSIQYLILNGIIRI